MTRGETRTTIRGPAGALEVAINVPVPLPDHGLRGIALVAHPHPQQGGTLDNKVAQTLAKTFVALGYAGIRFNFRGAGKSEGEFDDGVEETDDALAALAYARAEFPALAAAPPVLAGFSFGTFIQSRVARVVSPERMALVGPAVARFAVDALPADTVSIVLRADLRRCAGRRIISAKARGRRARRAGGLGARSIFSGLAVQYGGGQRN